jgi:hypothetical protein
VSTRCNRERGRGRGTGEREGRGDISAWAVAAMTSARITGRPRRRALLSGPVMNCVYGAADAPKASAMVIEWVEPAPWEGDARYKLRVAMMEVESLPVQSWMAMVVELSQPRISNTTPCGAAVVNSGVRNMGVLVCHSCPMRRLDGERQGGRSGMGVIGLSE